MTFETKVWENDWRYILSGNYLDQMITRCNYPFKEKILIINNVNDKREVIQHTDQKVKEGIIDTYYFADDYADRVLSFFEIDRDSFKTGYYYSISELVGIYLCKTEYLLHFSGDSFMQQSNTGWIDNAIEIFRKRNDIVVANPAWNSKYTEAKKESSSEIEGFFLGYGFSDQCYLIRMDVFKNRIYNEVNPVSARYPKYGGELFEKRVDSYMRNHNLLRMTSKEVSYINRNFSKNVLIYKCKFLSRLIAQKRMRGYTLS